MSGYTVETVLRQQRGWSAITAALDEELAAQHGLAWPDFVLLDAVATAGGALGGAELAARLHLRRTRLVLQLIPLEKLGIVARAAGTVSLRPGGQRLLREAQDTVAAVCERLPAAALSSCAS